ncbi:MAG: hypothetical protein WC783_03935 [Candidatus Paceibacterota bacterium]|jgi:hypothetical protein
MKKDPNLVKHIVTGKSNDISNSETMISINEHGFVKCKNCGDRLDLSDLTGEKLVCACGNVGVYKEDGNSTFKGNPDYVYFKSAVKKPVS